MDNPFQIWQPSPSPTSLPPPSSNSVPPAAFPLQIRRQPPHQRHLAASQWLRRHPAAGSAYRRPPPGSPSLQPRLPSRGPARPIRSPLGLDPAAAACSSSPSSSLDPELVAVHLPSVLVARGHRNAAVPRASRRPRALRRQASAPAPCFFLSPLFLPSSLPLSPAVPPWAPEDWSSPPWVAKLRIPSDLVILRRIHPASRRSAPFPAASALLVVVRVKSCRRHAQPLRRLRPRDERTCLAAVDRAGSPPTRPGPPRPG